MNAGSDNALRGWSCVMMLLAASTAWSHQPAALKETAWSFIDSRANVFADANQTIWNAAETSLEEMESATTLQQLLADGGFEVEAGVAGMPSAFTGRRAGGGGILHLLRGLFARNR